MATKRKTQSKQKKKKISHKPNEIKEKKKGDPTIQKFGDMAEDAK